MSKALRNEIKNYIFPIVEEKMLEENAIITPRFLDNHEQILHDTLNKDHHQISKTSIREIMVESILANFGIQAFGVKPNIKGPTEITAKGIRKYKKLRANGFN